MRPAAYSTFTEMATSMTNDTLDAAHYLAVDGFDIGRRKPKITKQSQSSAVTFGDSRDIHDLGRLDATAVARGLPAALELVQHLVERALYGNLVP